MFELRFDESRIEYWAARNDSDLSNLEKIGDDVRKRGFVTRQEFLNLCEVKSPRTKTRCASNSADFIGEVTRVALSSTQERLRIQVLTLLDGVAWPTASFLLHFCSVDMYPVLDFRALWSLNTEQPAAYQFSFWQSYTSYCRTLAVRNCVSMRTLDSALWQYSKENQKQENNT